MTLRTRPLRRRSRSAENVVRGDAEQPGDDLGKRKLFAVAVLARVGGEQLDRLLGNAPLGVELELERWLEAFELGIAGLACHDQGDDRPFLVARF